VAVCELLCGVLQPAQEYLMATNLHLDDDLVRQALELGQHRSKKDAVNAALASYVASLKRLKSVKEFGSFEFDDDFDYKKARQAS